MWELAYPFGDKEDIALWNASSDLYLKALNYEMNHNIPTSEPGTNPTYYFLWLNREMISSTIPQNMKQHLDNTMLNAKKLKADLIKKQQNNRAIE